MPSVLLITFVLGIYVQLICSESFSIVLSLISLQCTVWAEPMYGIHGSLNMYQFKSMCGVFSIIFPVKTMLPRIVVATVAIVLIVIIVFYSLQYAGQEGRNIEWSSQHHLLISIALLLWTSCYDYFGIIVVSSFKYICILFVCLFAFFSSSHFISLPWLPILFPLCAVHHQYMLSSHVLTRTRRHQT